MIQVVDYENKNLGRNKNYDENFLNNNFYNIFLIKL